MSSTILHRRPAVVEHEEASEGFRRLVLDVPEIAQIANPGQFVHALCGTSHDPLLRRPFSIYYADPDAGQLTLLYEIRGRGTALLAQKKAGDEVDLIGPLGNGFRLPESGDQPVFLLGGGIGAAPLYFLAHRIAEKVGSRCMTFDMGARTASGHVCFDEWYYFCPEEPGTRYGIATDDGSVGERCLVTDLLIRRIEGLSGPGLPLVYACGPTPMLKAVSGITKANDMKCQVSLEAKMACGVGACMSCVVKVREGDSHKYTRVCKEGPVFDADEVIW